MPSEAMPSEMTTAAKADEIFRGWVIDERLCYPMRPLTGKENPNTWGIFLVAALHHIGNAIHAETGQNTGELKELILQRFSAEIAAPTDIHAGNFYDA